MNRKQLWSGVAALAAAGLCVAAATVAVPAQDIAPPPGGDAVADGQGYEALTRGPLHEAFANPYATNPEPGVIIDQRPPDPIDEVPPDQMPEGDNVVWIPGYWGWDPDGEQFLWVSGLWRNVPADRRWVPGYWAEADGGWQWVAGFWTSVQTDQLAYLPEPPPSLEQGPNIEPPDGDYFWIPGCWVWQDANYDWRPGYWAQAMADWVWVPDQYVWTPYGCVFVPGYWDYTFVDRGVIFAPVVFQQAVYTQPGFQYAPTVVIDSAPLLMHLFVSPTYSHYFYGDYYAFQPAQPRFGFQPWVNYARRPSLYDPLLTYYQWSYGQRNVNIVQRLTVWNQYFVRNDNYRPPRTFRQQRQFLAQANQADLPIQATSLAFASPLQEFAQTHPDHGRFERVPEPARARFTENAQALRQFQAQRGEFEVSAAAQSPPAHQAQPGQPAAAQAQAAQTLTLPEATAVAPVAQPGATPGRDAAPGANAAVPDSTPGQSAHPEPPAPPQPGQSPQSSGETGDQSANGRPRAEDRPARARPGRDATDENPPNPSAEAADRRGPRDGQPARPDRPGADTAGSPPADTPNAPTNDPNPPTADDAAPDAAGPTLPDRSNAGDRRDRNARGTARQRAPAADAAAPANPPGLNVPGVDRPNGAPPEDAVDTEQGPRFPRFGTARNRGPQAGPGIDGATGASPNGPIGPMARPGLGRRGGGFDPFSGLPPGADVDGAAQDATDAAPRAGRRSGLGGALTPDAADPAQPGPPADRRPRGRGRSALPGGGEGLPGGLTPGQPPGGPPALNGPRRGRGGPNAAGLQPNGGAPENQSAAPAGPPARPQADPAGPPTTPPAQGGGNGGGPKPKKERDKGGPGG